MFQFMGEKRHIIPIRDESDAETAQATAAREDEVLALDESWEAGAAWDVETPVRRFDWLAPALAGLAVAVWTGIYVWTLRAALLAGGTTEQWTGWVSQWSMPVLLILVLWLVAMRSSRREASRFADAAQALSAESARLEDRLVAVNRELSLARDFIAAQSRDLDTLGRVAGDRLSEHAGRLSALIHENGNQIDSIASVSGTALENMEKLRGQLPVVSNSARDVTNQIGNAGRTAQGQLQELVSGFHRLNEFGEASERQVQSLRVKVDAALGAFETQASKLDSIASERFAALNERSEAFRAELDGQEVEALAAIRRRADALLTELEETRATLTQQEEDSLSALRARVHILRDEGARIAGDVARGSDAALANWKEALSTLETDLLTASEEADRIDAAMREAAAQRGAVLTEEAARAEAAIAELARKAADEVKVRSQEIVTQEETALARMEERLGRLDAALAERGAAQLASGAEFSDRVEALAKRLGTLAAQVEQIAAQGEETQQGLGSGIEALATQLSRTGEALRGTDHQVAELTDASVRLLELIQASAQHSSADLPAAMATAELRLSTLNRNVEAIDHVLEEAATKGEALAGFVASAQQASEAAMEQTGQTHGKLSAGFEQNASQIAALQAQLETLAARSSELTASTQEELRAALSSLEEANRTLITELGSGSAAAVEQLASRLGAETAEALDRMIEAKGAEAVRKLELAATEAAERGRETAVQLRDQMARLDELAGHLERRVTHAREKAEEKVSNDFARRVALISESLNSNAIDIAKALSNEVTDTAWAAYLKGDRGIFTRRAVRLLDSSESRAIAEIYENDPDFREHVSRYVHDFEAMLRELLSTRDGHALSVTLLSSDMGKLYVALAHAIERLRD